MLTNFEWILCVCVHSKAAKIATEILMLDDRSLNERVNELRERDELE